MKIENLDLRKAATSGRLKPELQDAIGTVGVILKIEGLHEDDHSTKAFFSFRRIQEFIENRDSVNKIHKATTERDPEFIKNNKGLIEREIEVLETSIADLKQLLKQKENILESYKKHL